MMERDVYQENGYDSRDDYLNSLSEDYGIPLDAVLAVAEILGPDEDFDGLGQQSGGCHVQRLV